MEGPWKKPWVILMEGIVLIQLLCRNNGCFTEEKRSLLDFKASYSNDALLPSWVNDSPKSNCCEWERVTCDPFSGHVTHLSLESVNRNSGQSWGGCLDNTNSSSLNGSLFLSFKYLRYLSLSANCFDGFIWERDNGSKSTLKRLETLDFSSNNFKENIMEFLYSLISLRKLILAHNKIGGLFPSKELSVLCNLESLDLSFNNLSGSLTTQGPFSLGNLTSLQTLDLSHNSLSGNIPEPLLARLSSLEHLSLCFNNFEGLFSLNILANQSKLKVLQIGDMSSKTFQVQTENRPWNASFQLEDLEIFSCKLNLPTRTFPSFLSSQNALRRVDLSEANLAGTFPNWFFMNKPRLKYVFLSKNSFVGSFELPVNQSQQMNQLYTLDISNNLIEGELPTNIGFFFPFLDYLDVSSNRFDGSIPSSIGEMSTLIDLDLSYNNFSGNVPKHFFKGCISLQSLLVDNNNFNGTFPSFVRSPNLTRITASRNNFEGQITEEMCVLIRLLALDLSYNNFSGALPSCLNMPSAGLINLQGNSLTGTIPEALLNGTMRMAIDLSNNKFVGTIPESVGGLQSLMFLLLGGNQLQGHIPNQICQLKYLQILDLSQNNFTGSVPSCFNSTTFASGKQSLLFGLLFNPLLQLIIKGLSLSYNTELLEIMTVLDLSSNQLTGEIPHQIGELSGLHALNLSHNHLEGPIPTSFHNLQSIESMDLSNNSLSGEIPLQLEDLHYLSVFNVCYNNLSGKAPNQGQFGTFDESSYRGNQYLKWGNSNRGNATLLPPPPNLPSGGDNDDSVIDFTSFRWSFVASFVTVLLTFVTILWINPYWRRVWFYFMEELLFKCFGWFLEDAFY
ncbi:receptor-like protein 15 [Arachis stenosperma]|uniref:receptor-like protein 15 n=1 Tax=Arachis stenosperma TaxID=217475 RepID=UPI0025AC231E|nr:receptor-like protein 15 [Arachis stenosperma]